MPGGVGGLLSDGESYPDYTFFYSSSQRLVHDFGRGCELQTYHLPPIIDAGYTARKPLNPL